MVGWLYVREQRRRLLGVGGGQRRFVIPSSSSFCKLYLIYVVYSFRWYWWWKTFPIGKDNNKCNVGLCLYWLYRVDSPRACNSKCSSRWYSNRNAFACSRDEVPRVPKSRVGVRCIIECDTKACYYSVMTARTYLALAAPLADVDMYALNQVKRHTDEIQKNNTYKNIKQEDGPGHANRPFAADN